MNKERAPWYIVTCRIIMLLLATALSFEVMFMYFCAAIVFIDTATGWALQETILDLCEKYSTESIVLTLVAYIAWSIGLINEFMNYIMGRKQHGKR